MKEKWENMDLGERIALLRRLGFGGIARVTFAGDRWKDLPAYVRTRIEEGQTQDSGLPSG